MPKPVLKRRPRDREDPEKNRVWYEVATEDGNGDGKRLPGAALTRGEVMRYGDLLVEAFLHDGDLRRQYYNLSRTWHHADFMSGHKGGGKFGEQWCSLFESKLDIPKRLQLDDISYLHYYLFYTLHRSVLAATGHDIEPDLPITIKSFHYVPNDGSMQVVDMRPLGFSKLMP